MHIALSGASCKSEAGLKLLGDIKLAYHAAGTGLAKGTDESSMPWMLWTASSAGEAPAGASPS